MTNALESGPLYIRVFCIFMCINEVLQEYAFEGGLSLLKAEREGKGSSSRRRTGENEFWF